MHISDGVLHPAVLGAGFAAAGGLAALGLRKIESRDYPLVGVMTAGFFVASLFQIKVPPTSVHLTLNSLVGVVLGLKCFPAILIAIALQALLIGHGGLTTIGVNTVMMAFPGFLAGALLRRGLKSGRPGWIPYVLVLIVLSFTGAGMLASALVETGLLETSVARPLALAVGLVLAALLVVLERTAKGGPVFRWGFAAGALAVFGAALILFLILAFAPLAPHAERDPIRTVAYYAFIVHVPIMFVEGIIVTFLIRYLGTVAPEILRIQSPSKGEGA